MARRVMIATDVPSAQEVTAEVLGHITGGSPSTSRDNPDRKCHRNVAPRIDGVGAHGSHGLRFMSGYRRLWPIDWRAPVALLGVSTLWLTTGCSNSRAAAAPWTNRLGMTFVEVPPGTLIMGEASPPDEAPAHGVSFASPYWIGVTELTQEQWKSVMGTSPWTGMPGLREGPTFPAVHMSWKSAHAFIDRLNALDPGHGYRLPSEAEWERVCKAGDPEHRAAGTGYVPIGDYAWINDNASRANDPFAHAVGVKKPNALGIRDILGNVWEWCEDDYRDGYRDAPTDGGPRRLKDVFSHVYRGGGWDSPLRAAACSTRSGLDEDDHSPSIGMRVAASRP